MSLVLLALNAGTGDASQPKPAASTAPQTAASGSEGGQYAETDVCKTCHEEIWEKHFAGTPHSALLKGDQHGCQACHGPAQAHVEGGGDVTKIIRFEDLSPTQTAAICTKCHQASLETQNLSKSEHMANGVSCTTCHSPHKSTDVNFMLVKSQKDLCFGCHAPQKAEFNRPYRRRLEVGLIEVVTYGGLHVICSGNATDVFCDSASVITGGSKIVNASTMQCPNLLPRDSVPTP